MSEIEALVILNHEFDSLAYTAVHIHRMFVLKRELLGGCKCENPASFSFFLCQKSAKEPCLSESEV